MPSGPLRRVISTLLIRTGPRAMRGYHDLLECGHTIIHTEEQKAKARRCTECGRAS